MQSVDGRITAITMPVKEQSPASTVWRVINLVMAVFFMLAASVNMNDDDWYFWVPMYTVPSLLCLSAAAIPSFTDNAAWQMITSIDFLFCLLYGLYQMFALLGVLSGALDNPLAHEEGREMGGLLIILAWAGISRFSPLSRQKSNIDNRGLMAVFLWITATLAVVPLLTWSLCLVGDWRRHLGHCNNMFS